MEIQLLFVGKTKKYLVDELDAYKKKYCGSLNFLLYV